MKKIVCTLELDVSFLDDRLRALGINQSDLARTLKVSRQYISEIVGKKSASLKALARIAEILECNPKDLLE